MAKLSREKPLGWQGPPLEPPPSEPGKKKPSSTKHPWLWILGGLVGIIIIAGLFSNDNTNHTSTNPAPTTSPSVASGSTSTSTSPSTTSPSTEGTSTTAKPSESAYKIDKIGAWVMAKEFVLRRLKAPRTAKWPWYTDQLVAYLGNREYLVSAYVDAQNSFGALIRTYFTCRVRDDGDRWTLLSISFSD
jgi:hypothetical protein